MKNNNLQNFIACLCLLVFSACDNNNPTPSDPPKNETELITSFIIQFRDSATNAVHTVQFSDPDGDGGNAPTQFDSIQLNANSTYYASLILLDESKNPVDSINQEIIEEAEDHLFVFIVNSLGLSIQSTDADPNQLPLGLESIWRCTNPSSGRIRIILKHQPGIKTGNPDLGETDLDLEFQAEIK